MTYSDDQYKVMREHGPWLFETVKLQHSTLDYLLALCIEHVPGFMPTKSPAWPVIETARSIIATIQTPGEPSHPAPRELANRASVELLAACCHARTTISNLQHAQDCAAYSVNEYRCDCGLQSTLDELVDVIAKAGGSL